MRHIYKDF